MPVNILASIGISSFPCRLHTKFQRPHSGHLPQGMTRVDLEHILRRPLKLHMGPGSSALPGDGGHRRRPASGPAKTTRKALLCHFPFLTSFNFALGQAPAFQECPFRRFFVEALFRFPFPGP